MFPQFVAGISRGMLYFLVASGLTLIFGVLGVINFTHGAMYMLGAFLCYAVTAQILSSGQFNFWVALFVAPIIVAIVAGLIERFVLRRIYGREHLYQLLLTTALVYMITDLVKMCWGTLPVSVPKPSLIAGSVSVLGAIIPGHYIFILILSVIALIGLSYFLYSTRYGTMIRAAAADPQMTRCLGVNCNRIYLVVFIIGCWLAALGGAAATTMLKPILGMENDIIVLVFVIAVVGGLGSIPGALVASLIIAQVEAFGTLLMPRLSIVLIFIMMAVILVARPSGLFGKEESRWPPQG